MTKTGRWKRRLSPNWDQLPDVAKKALEEKFWDRKQKLSDRNPGWNTLTAETDAKRRRMSLRKSIVDQIQAAKSKLADLDYAEKDTENKLLDIIVALEMQLQDLGDDVDDEAGPNFPSEVAAPCEEHLSSAEDDHHEESQHLPTLETEDANKEANMSPAVKSLRGSKNMSLEAPEVQERKLQKQEADRVRKELKQKTNTLKVDIENQIVVLSRKMNDPSCDPVKHAQMEKLLGKLQERLDQLNADQGARKNRSQWSMRYSESDKVEDRNSPSSSASACPVAPVIAHSSHPQPSSASPQGAYTSVSSGQRHDVPRPRPSCAPGVYVRQDVS